MTTVQGQTPVLPAAPSGPQQLTQPSLTSRIQSESVRPFTTDVSRVFESITIASWREKQFQHPTSSGAVVPASSAPNPNEEDLDDDDEDEDMILPPISLDDEEGEYDDDEELRG